MTTTARPATQSPTRHTADSHDLIRVHGARENNLKNVSVELPKRRLTVFTGVSGSGKSSLVFCHDRRRIAADDQRDIQRFVQGFMPTLARPDVDVLEGLTTAIIVDQERMGANPRSTVGTATRRQRNAAHPVQPSRGTAHRLAAGVLVQRRLDQRRRGGHVEKSGAPSRSGAASRSPAACDRAARAWARSRTRPHRAVRDRQVPRRGAR